jgi:hypothetical protein
MWVLDMLQEVTLENKLNEIVYQKVQRGNYPSPPLPLDEQIRIKNNEIYALKAEKVPRPPTKQEYFALLESLGKEVQDLIAKQNQNNSEYQTARGLVDTKYNEDIATAKLDPINIGEALAACIDYQLTDTLWWTASDCGLSTQQRVETDTWRLDMMKIVYNYPVVSDAVVEYNKLLSVKPNYTIKFGVTDKKQIIKLEVAIEALKVVAAEEVAAEKLLEVPKEPVIEEPIAPVEEKI